MKIDTKKFSVLLVAIVAAISILAGAHSVIAQGLDMSLLGKAATEAWPTYSGDYSGRRFSTLTQINQSNVKDLTLAWVSRMTPGPGGETIVGGEAQGNIPSTNGARMAGSILQVNGILYVDAPDNAWAADARTGHVLWHYFWKTRGGTHIGNRGMAMYHDVLYFETPDDFLICLDAKTGQEKWHKEIADFNQQYFSTMAPIVIGNHLIIGTGDDMDAPGYVRSLDPETGETQWTFWTEPLKMGDPGSETWPNLDSMRHGGGNVWIPGAYDPDLHLYYFGTGNATPTLSAGSRKGDNLYTSCIVAVNVDTGKMAWYYQVSPHDTHDYDAAQTPILADAEFGGKMRKLLLHANRNGYFFVLDRVTGERLISGPYSSSVNWAHGLNAKGAPERDPMKDAQPGGALVSPSNPGVSNWPPASFDPQTGLFYVQTRSTYSIFYLTDSDPRNAQGFGGGQEQSLGTVGNYLTAIDYKTGKIAWQHEYPTNSGSAAPFGGGGLPGLLTTAGHLLFGGDPYGNLVAFDPANGSILWHSRLAPAQIGNAPETYLLDGKQYLLVTSGDSIFAFTLR